MSSRDDNNVLDDINVSSIKTANHVVAERIMIVFDFIHFESIFFFVPKLIPKTIHR